MHAVCECDSHSDMNVSDVNVMTVQSVTIFYISDIQFSDNWCESYYLWMRLRLVRRILGPICYNKHYSLNKM